MDDTRGGLKVAQNRPQPQDGSLPAALRRLTYAVSALCDPKPVHLPDQHHTTWTPSLYQQLRDSLPGQQGATRSPARSLPTCWIDCLDLLTEIDGTVAAWQTLDHHTHQPPTVQRLHLIETRPWRPQDCRSLDQISGCLEAWTRSITALLVDDHTKHVQAACPACGRTTVYRRDNGGDTIRTPALKLTTAGCTCQHCHTTWAPSQFTFLARVIGCTTTLCE